MKKLLAFALALAMLLGLTACGTTPDGTTADEGTQTEDPTGTPLVLVENKATEFVVMRGDMAPQYETDAAIGIRKDLMEAGDFTIRITTDWVKRGEEPPVDTKEILVGTTNRAETADAMDRVKDGEYIIKAYENRLVIYSSSAAGMKEAADVFRTTFLDNCGGTVKIPTDYELIAKTSYIIFDENDDTGVSNPSSLSEKQKASLMFYVGCNSALVFGVAERMDLSNPEVKTYFSGDKIFVPAAFVTEKLGGTSSYDGATKTLTLNVGGKTIMMTSGSKTVKVDATNVTMDVAIEEKDGVVFAPIEYFSQMLDKQMYRNAEGFAVITTTQNIFSASADAQAIRDTVEKIKECHYAMADVTPIADKLLCDYGQPAMIDPGATYPDVKLTTYFNATNVSIKVVKDGKTLQTVDVGNVSANTTETYKVQGKADALGEYQIIVTLTVNGTVYEYVRYFTSVDTKQFGNGNVAVAYKDAGGKMVYVCDFMGNRILDYSLVGYEKGKELPTADYIASLPKVTISPVAGDNGPAIQAAIDSLKSKPVNAEGYRGVVELSPGTYECATSFNLNVSGVILRGAGQSEADVILALPGGAVINNSGGGGRTVMENTKTNVLGTYLPAGATSLQVADASKFAVGDDVVVMKTVTYPWIVYMEMSELFRNGAQQTWIAEGTIIYHERTIVAINGNTITLDTGVSDSFDSKYGDFPVATIAKCTRSGYIDHTGMENFTIEHAQYKMDNNQNSWIRNIASRDNIGSNGKVGNSFLLAGNTKYVTMEGCVVSHTRNTETAAPADFTFYGCYLLVKDCETPLYQDGNTWGYVFQSGNAGPNVIYNCMGATCPHQRWSTGVLTDTCTVPEDPAKRAGIDFINRTTMGSGHGWTIGWSIVWNTTAPHFKIAAANGTTNWAIGCIGTRTDPVHRKGLFFSLGTKITWGSLYEAQLAERLAK